MYTSGILSVQSERSMGYHVQANGLQHSQGDKVNTRLKLKGSGMSEWFEREY